MSRKKNIGLYTPLSLLQITADYPQNGLPTIREAVSLAAKRTNCEADLYKQTVSMFVAEVLFHVLRHPMPDEPMFDYIAQAIQTLNETDEPQNFHLQFLIGLADKLGFKMPTEPAMPHTRTERQKVLKDLCHYFEEHVETWQTPRSLDVLIEVFN
jgi:DNA repair protein RecO (recombination protein O)